MLGWVVRFLLVWCLVRLIFSARSSSPETGLVVRKSLWVRLLTLMGPGVGLSVGLVGPREGLGVVGAVLLAVPVSLLGKVAVRALVRGLLAFVALVFLVARGLQFRGGIGEVGLFALGDSPVVRWCVRRSFSFVVMVLVVLLVTRVTRPKSGVYTVAFLRESRRRHSLITFRCRHDVSDRMVCEIRSVRGGLDGY